ncbi:hypothetical protein [Jeotgalibacillus sp. S-D1]|nr:hypothetical protein [Jeotgalibacillus sp. S-D1]
MLRKMGMKAEEKGRIGNAKQSFKTPEAKNWLNQIGGAILSLYSVL